MCFVPARRALFRPLNLQKRREHVVFCMFWLKMCFAPQRCPLLTHLNFQKRSEAGAFCAFSVRNVLRATTDNGVHFFDIWTSKRGPNLVCFVHFDWEMCFAHDGVYFFDILTSKSGPRWIFCAFWLQSVLRATMAYIFFHISSGQPAPHPRFSEPTFGSPWTTHHWKKNYFATFLPFRGSVSSFFQSLSSDVLSLF